MQNKGYYHGAQGHQGHRGWYHMKARMRLPISVVTSYLVPYRTYRSLLFTFWTLCVFEPPFGGT